MVSANKHVDSIYGELHIKLSAIDGIYSDQLPLSIGVGRRYRKHQRLTIWIIKKLFYRYVAPYQTTGLEKTFSDMFWSRVDR